MICKQNKSIHSSWFDAHTIASSHNNSTQWDDIITLIHKHRHRRNETSVRDANEQQVANVLEHVFVWFGIDAHGHAQLTANVSERRAAMYRCWGRGGKVLVVYSNQSAYRIPSCTLPG